MSRSVSRTVMVTGGGRGLGRAMALALANAGHRVLALGHIATDEAELMALAKSEACVERIRYGCMDLRAPGGCDQAVAWARGAWGEVDALINNAGLTLTFVDEQMYTRKTPRRFYESSDEVIRGIYETNVMVPEMLAARLAPGMVERGWGRIINVTTMESTMQRLGFCPYGASKAALELSSMVWAAELKETGVTVNVLNPGGGANTLGIAPEVRQASARGEIPKLVEPDQMRAPAVWLCSDAAQPVTGMRFEAKIWDPELSPEVNAKRIGRPCGVWMDKA
jgi:3-oxoacyl-[acyl-carrier protein] reductase